MRCILGIDTSNYTTSLCAVDSESGKLMAEARKLLPVEHGSRGLRQSDALFFHVTQLPEMMNSLMAKLRQTTALQIEWEAVGVSVRPRPFSSSYMPVFLAGRNFAHTFASALSIPVIHTSHQEGHVSAAEYFMPEATEAPFLAVHISGGTSDVMVAKRTRFGYDINLIGEGADLHAGQFVDRVGVALGLSFPAGPNLEKLALGSSSEPSIRFSASVEGSRMSFSGPCSAALRAINQGYEPVDIARGVEACIANSVSKAITNGLKEYPLIERVVVAGGVASNAWIKARLVHRFRILHPNRTILFAPPAYSSDNALGVASISYRFLRDIP